MEILKVHDLCKTYGKGEAEVEALKNIPAFTKKQWFCLACMFAFIIFYAFTQWHIGFVAIIFSVIMIFAGCVDHKDLIKNTK